MRLRVFSTIDRIGKSCVVVPVLLLGIALTEISERLIRFGAWLSDYEDLG